MLINDFRIENYKSFRSTDVVRLTPGFNVFVGKNNSGKTALLECLSLSSLIAKPHRHSGIAPRTPLNARSSIKLTVTLEPADIAQAFFSGGSFYFPLGRPMAPADALQVVRTYMQEPRTLSFGCAADQNNNRPISNLSYPSHGLFQQNNNNFAAVVYPNEARTDFRVNSIEQNTNDSIGTLCGNLMMNLTYTFRAERMSIGACTHGDRSQLVPNAQNLPEVLNVLQGQRARFERLNAMLHEIFPAIRYATVTPRGSQDVILLWNSAAPEERSDLAVELSESGTGVGQVLAILYILVTSDTPRTIIIDEPNTFLHPGAIRKLVDIMRRNSVKHQYIITTHSPEMIRITEAQSVHLVDWREEQSFIEFVNASDIAGFRRTLNEVGVRLSDLFGADNIICVEGATEVECFPKIMRAARIGASAGLSIVALRATGDFEGRKSSAIAIWEIYERLATGGKLMPLTLAISLDREGRADADMEDAARRSNGLIRYLARRCFENYLIHPPAITALLNSLLTFRERAIAEQAVRDWLGANGENAAYDKGRMWSGNLERPEWLATVDAAHLLRDLVAGLSEAREQYRKVEHGAWLTEWICANDLRHFVELADYIRTLLVPG